MPSKTCATRNTYYKRDSANHTAVLKIEKSLLRNIKGCLRQTSPEIFSELFYIGRSKGYEVRYSQYYIIAYDILVFTTNMTPSQYRFPCFKKLLRCEIINRNAHESGK